VGAGIGGTSTAHFMRELFGTEAEIDIFEKGKIGDRLATVNIEGNKYESGGAIIHPDNLYMVNFTEILGNNLFRERKRCLNKIFHNQITVNDILIMN